jgi:hypothetical protein
MSACCVLPHHACRGCRQVFLCIKMLLTSGGGGASAAQVDGCVMYVFNIQGFITHIVLYRCVLQQQQQAPCVHVW